uniref:Transmembrane protein n=1 Tax=Arundo donax TaxID=35708 RepID=A0A0A9A7A5_ARUDO
MVVVMTVTNNSIAMGRNCLSLMTVLLMMLSVVVHYTMVKSHSKDISIEIDFSFESTGQLHWLLSPIFKLPQT